MVSDEFQDWRGRIAVVVASGPSLKAMDCARTVAHRTIAVNASYQLVPWADVVYMGDMACVKQYAPRLPFPDRLWSCTQLAKQQYGARWAPSEPGEGLSPHPRLRLHGNSGMQAINLAYLFGARKIVLLGFDMKPAPDGQRHWHPEHPRPLVQTSCFAEWILKGEKLATALKTKGVDVVDCTPGGMLRGFRKGELETELCIADPQPQS